MDYILPNNILPEDSNATDYESSYGHCRCCLEEGHHRDITNVYNICGAKEVYADIFLDCFNVFLSTNTNLSTLICSKCVNRLRKARDFKALVLRTEEQLMDALQDSDNEQMVLVNVPVAKETLDTTIGFKIQVNEFENTTKIKKTKNQAKETTTEVNKDGTSSFDTDIEASKTPKQRKLTKSKRALIINTYQQLVASNATLFKSKRRSGFPCFYCKEIFEGFDLLKQHQNEEHSKTDLLRALEPYSAESLVVYADVKDLKCTTCELPMPDLKELKSHLIIMHDVKFHKNVTDRVVPFKLMENYYECQICSFNFETFGSIEKHMNTHFRNYACNICGSGFVTMMRLKCHINTRHSEGTFLCEYCNKVFNTQLKLKVHIDFVHKMLKRLKCLKCSERFSDYFVQKKHMVEVHGEKPIVYRCNVCNKGFRRRYTLSCHTKRHLEQKDINCDVCPYACYTRTELKEHKFKHHRLNFEHPFICSVCYKHFTRKTSLRVHMKMHSENGYGCSLCEDSFTKSSSLRIHKRKHHLDFNSGYVIRHACTLCDQSFDRIDDLKTHIRNHDNILCE